MPTDASAAGGRDRPAETADDELTFAVQDLGRERAPARPPADLGFVPARAPVTAPAQPAPDALAPPTARPAPPALDGFVIREAQGAVPTAPVDALVVGAPAATPDAEEADGDGADDASEAAPPTSFRISSAAATAVPAASELWTTRNPVQDAATDKPHPGAARRGWSTRHSEVVDRSAHATMLRLREEAVNVSWKAAWIAVTTTNPGLLRRRRQEPPAG